MRLLALLFMTGTAAAQATSNTTSNGSVSPSTGQCPPGGLSCLPVFTQPTSTLTPFTLPIGPRGQLEPVPESVPPKERKPPPQRPDLK